MSVICGISTYHLIDTSSPCRLIGAELSSAHLPCRFLSLTLRVKRQTWHKGAAEGNVNVVERYGKSDNTSESGGPEKYRTLFMQVNQIFLQNNVTKTEKNITR